MTKSNRFLYGVAAVIGVCLLLAIFQSTANADVSNPHPTPPSNSITNAMLQTGIVHNNNLVETDTFNASGFTATTTHSDVAYDGALDVTGASTTINGVNLQWPSTQCANKQTWQNNGSGTLACTSLSNAFMSTTFTADESIATGTAVALGDGTTTLSTAFTASTQSDEMTTSKWEAHDFTTGSPAKKLTAVTITYNCNNGLTAVIATIAIYANSGGAPTGAALGSQNDSFSCNGTQQYPRTVTFATPVTVAANTEYWIVASSNQSNSSFHLFSEQASTNTNADQLSSNSGSSWGASGHDYIMQAQYTSNTLGNLYEASSASLNFRSYDVVGIAEGGGNAGASITVDMYGVSTATTTLTTGGEYFLQDANGQLGLSPGTNSIKLGFSLGASGFMIRLPNP
jgi:hypothetical protein